MTSAHRFRTPPARQSGVSMIEVLVALVIFAFGMLGLAGLQSRALVFGHQSLLRSQATALADDVLDRMRADRSNAKAGSWNTDLANPASSITGTAIFQTDLKDWKDTIEQLLPAGRASINVAAGGIVTVIVEWSEANATGGAKQQQLTTVSQL